MTTITSDSGNRPDRARCAQRPLAFAPGRVRPVRSPPCHTLISTEPPSRTPRETAGSAPSGPAPPDTPGGAGRPAGRRRARAAGEVTGITHDSRAVRPGDVYAALPGARFHGADFAAQAADLGAAAILTDPAGAERAAATGLPVLVTDDPRGRMGELAAEIYGHPGDGLLQIGITGTSGKTTTAYLVEGGLRGGRPQHRADRHGRDAHRRRAHQVRAHHPRSHRPPGPVRRHARARRRVGRHGGLQPRPGARPGRRLRLRRRRLQQPQPRAHGIPLRHGGLLPGEGAAVHAAAQPGSGWSTSTTSTAAGSLKEASVPVTTFSAEGHPDADWRAEDVEVGAVGSHLHRGRPRGRADPRRGPAARPVQRRQHPGRHRHPRRRRASTRRPPPTASPPSPACRAGWSASTRASRTSPSSTTPTRRTPSSRSCAPCARSPRAGCTSSSAAAATATRPSAARWAPPPPASPTPPY